jgi:hypothetical protein
MLKVMGTANSSIVSEEQQNTLMGQDDPAVDVQAVQSAVDQGGAVLLKGTFDFGDKGKVLITKDVKIFGESHSVGYPVTKIKRGFWTFNSPASAQLPAEIPGPKITIRGIHFDGALWTPIHLAHIGGATIINNKITNVQPFPSPVPIFGQSGLNFQQGILCGTAFVTPQIPAYHPGVFEGALTIADNEIDLINDTPTKTVAQGVFVFWTTGITAQILRNTIYNCSRNSIEIIDNFLGEDGRGSILIKDNKIETSRLGVPVPTPFTPNGIVAGWYLDTTGGIDPKRNMKHTIIYNSIRTLGETSSGIAVFTNGAVVSDNTLVSEGSNARSLVLSGADGYVAHNRIEGIGSHALVVRVWKPLTGSNIVFVDNDFNSFKSSVVDVLFEKETNNNVFFGSGGTVIDFGYGNQITGLKAVSQ